MKGERLEAVMWGLSCVCWLTVKELSALHDKHLNRPTLDDSVDEEHAIEIHTQQITQVNIVHVWQGDSVLHKLVYNINRVFYFSATFPWYPTPALEFSEHWKHAIGSIVFVRFLKSVVTLMNIKKKHDWD